MSTPNFRVCLEKNDGIVVHEVSAEYFVEDQNFVQFKNSAGKVVFAAQSYNVMSIEALQEPSSEEAVIQLLEKTQRWWQDSNIRYSREIDRLQRELAEIRKSKSLS